MTPPTRAWTPTVNKGQNVRIKDVPSTRGTYLPQFIAPGKEGVVRSTHTNDVIYITMNDAPTSGTWAFAATELELVNG